MEAWIAGFLFGHGAGMITVILLQRAYRGGHLSGKPTSPVVCDIAELLRAGRIAVANIEPHGICEMGVDYMGRRFLITWYSGLGNRLRSIELGGSGVMFCELPEAKYLLSVATERANRLFRERVAELESARPANSPSPPSMPEG